MSKTVQNTKAKFCGSLLGCSAISLLLLGNMVSSANAQSAFDDPSARMVTSSGGGGAVQAGTLVPVEEEVDGGSITIGATSNVVVLFRNEDIKPVRLGKINLYPSSNVSSSIILNECSSSPLPSGADCAMVVSVKGLQEGSWRVEMLVAHSGRSRLVTATLNGEVEADESGGDALSSDIELIPSEVDFGSLNSSQSLIRSIIFRNITSEPIDVTNIYIQSSDSSGYSLRSDCSRISTAQSCLATLSWSPQQKGPSEGILVIEHTGPSGVTSVPIKGEFSPESAAEAAIFPEAVPGRGLLVASMSEIAFGTGIVSTSAMTLSLVNQGDRELTLNEIKLSGTDTGLSVHKRGCTEGTVLDPIEACPLTIEWSPTREGAILDDLQIAHDGTRGVLVIPVRGEADNAVSKDSKAIVSKDGVVESGVDRTESIDGFVVTSHSPTKSIIAGPGGSRVVKHGEDIVLGGFSWTVSIVKNGVDLVSGNDKVTLLFDRSLSSGSRAVAATSSSSSGGSSSDDN